MLRSLDTPAKKSKGFKEREEDEQSLEEDVLAGLEDVQHLKDDFLEGEQSLEEEVLKIPPDDALLNDMLPYRHRLREQTLQAQNQPATPPPPHPPHPSKTSSPPSTQ